MKRLIFLMVILFSAGSLYTAVPLRDALENGVRLSSDIMNSELETKILEIQRRTAESAKLFSIDASGSYLYKSEKVNIRLPEMSLAPGLTFPGVEMTGGAFHNFDLKLGIYQPLFSGGQLSGSVRISELKKTMSMTAREILTLMMKGRIKSVFFRFQLLASEKRSREVLREKILNHLKKIGNFYSEELAGKSRVLETRVKLGEIDVTLRAVENEMNAAASVFKELTGMDIRGIDPGYREDVDGIDRSMEIFLSSHPELRMFSGEIDILEAGKKITAGKDLPQIGGFAEMHYGRPGLDFLGDEWGLYFQGGINIKLNIFNWGRSAREKQVADLRIMKVRNREKERVRKTRIKLSELYDSLENIGSRTEIMDEMMKDSIEESELKERLFKEKLISNLEYIDSLLNAENLRSAIKGLNMQSNIIKTEINMVCGKKEE